MERFVEEAVVLACLDYGDADRMVTLFTRGRGRLTAFAAGARKSKRRFAGALELGTHLKAQLVERAGGDICRLDGTDIVTSFFALRDDLPRIARALYCLELCRELTRDHEPHIALFDCLLAYLTDLDARKAGPTSLIKFELDALRLTGFMPRFAPCAICGQATGDRPRFDPDAGGVTCENCAHRAEPMSGPGWGPQASPHPFRVPQGIPVTAEVVKALAKLQDGERTPLPVDVRARCRELLNVFIAHHLGRKLKSVDFMHQVGTD